ncbi:hypothetical protein DM860_014167 [Cuscuta australis]|uniref:DUF4283 domain-containing protein n=1 Tax=Cuscuta australis TaxID=267555 RepID=A0A328DFG6_9ASTE|nr:hypothetical protein DM860_014167 [Cuscuta australis]
MDSCSKSPDVPNMIPQSPQDLEHQIEEVIDLDSKGFLTRIWKVFDIDDISFLKKGQFLVRFHKEEDRDEIIKRKYYLMDNKPVYVQKWYPGYKVNLMERKDIPIWVQFPELEMKYWSLSALSKLGSAIGQPIKRDRATTSRVKWSWDKEPEPKLTETQDEDKDVEGNKETKIISDAVISNACCKADISVLNKEIFDDSGFLEEVTRPFQECLEVCGLEDLPFEGPRFTWTNNQEIDKRIYSKLDRPLGNIEWILNLDYKVYFKERGICDHSSIVVKQIAQQVPSLHFSFYDMWTLDPHFPSLVAEVWDKEHQDYLMYQIIQKLKQLKGPLKKLNRKKEVLWIKWIHNRYLKNNNIWDCPKKNDDCYYSRDCFVKMEKSTTFTPENAKEDRHHLFCTFPYTKEIYMKIYEWIHYLYEGDTVESIGAQLLGIFSMKRRILTALLALEPISEDISKGKAKKNDGLKKYTPAERLTLAKYYVDVCEDAITNNYQKSKMYSGHVAAKYNPGRPDWMLVRDGEMLLKYWGRVHPVAQKFGSLGPPLKTLCQRRWTFSVKRRRRFFKFQNI